MATQTLEGAPTGYTLERAIVTTSLTAAIGDVILLFPVTPGMVIYDVVLNYVGTASSTVEVGDSGSATRYISSTSTATSGFLATNVVTAVTSGVISAGPGYKYTAADVIQATIGGAAIAAAQYSLSVTFSRTYNS